MPEPLLHSTSTSTSTASDLPLAAGATLLTLVGYVEPAARIPAGALVLTTLLLLLLGVMRHRRPFARPPGA